MPPLISALLFLLSVAARQNAVILILCRNSELEGITAAINSLEARFNATFKYPYVFLNDVPFTQEFKDRLSATTHGRAQFGLVSSADWDPPSGIDWPRARASWERMTKAGVPYANALSYHNMCRFFSRAFYNHPLLLPFDYYWRVEPNVSFHCDILEDPFDFLAVHNKQYGFVITIREFMDSVPTLGKVVAEFVKRRWAELPGGTHTGFMFTKGVFNGCHFWSNFEIASFKFFRSDLYRDFVDALEKAGGFYYERWGDAPVHSLAAAVLLRDSDIHFFNNIGYTHDGIMHCPQSGKNCSCSVASSIDFQPFSCLSGYLHGEGLWESRDHAAVLGGGSAAASPAGAPAAVPAERDNAH